MKTHSLDKNIIKKSFSKAASTYDAFSKLQTNVAEKLLKLNHKINFFPLNSKQNFALDIGCGTGSLANYFKDFYPDLNILGCDFSLPMLLKAREKLPGKNVRLLSSDCEGLPLRDSLFELAMSSLVYQWAPNTANAFKEVCRVLKPDGTFLFATLGPKTLEELRISLKKAQESAGEVGFPQFMKFQEKSSLTADLKNAGFDILSIETVLNTKTYKNIWELLKTLKATGASPSFPNGDKSLAKGLILRKTKKIYEKCFSAPRNDGIVASYDVVYAAARKI